MNDDTSESDPFEEELRVLRPRELSGGFIESLRKRLDRPAPHDDGPQPRRGGSFKLFVPLAAVAALILIAFGLVRHWPTREDPSPSKDEIASPVVESPDEQGGELRRPTLMAYNRAIGNEPGSLEGLLDYHARTLLPNVPDPDLAYQEWP
jgi:hypothetical protein